MKELSLHVLDIAENSLSADAKLVEIFINEDYKNNLFEIIIKDDGKGIKKEFLKKIDDPFFTTKEKKIGLGLALLKEKAINCGGSFFVDSAPEKGTEVKAKFKLDNIDLPPLGNMASTIVALILKRPEADIRYIHKVDEDEFFLDTREIKRELEDVPINHPIVIGHIKEEIKKGLSAINAGKYSYIWRINHAKAYNTGS